VIVFHPNGFGDAVERTTHAASVVFVKRLIGLPGDWIQSTDGRVQICRRRGSGCRTLHEPYTTSPTSACNATGRNFGPLHVLPGHYFMMGDNRQDSDDSRCWGQITRKQIIGRAFVIYWPLTRLRVF
jgi:signal peptidase I